jgi:hypothetical protein
MAYPAVVHDRAGDMLMVRHVVTIHAPHRGQAP